MSNRFLPPLSNAGVPTTRNRFLDPIPATVGSRNRFLEPLPPVAPAATSTESPTLLERTLEVLMTPSRMVAGAVRGVQTGEGIGRALTNLPGGVNEDDFDDVLAGAGIADSTSRRVAGFAGDLVLDPLNIVPVAPIAKGIAHTTGLVTGARAVGEVALKVPHVAGVVEDLARMFIPHRGLNRFTTEIATPMGQETKTFQDLTRLHASKLAHVRETAGLTALRLFDGLTPDEAFTVAKALDTGTALADPRLETMRKAGKSAFEVQFQKEAAAGMLPPGSQRENYVTHLLLRDPVMRDLQARKLTAHNPFQLRREMSLEDGVKAGVFEPDIRRIMATRLATGDRALANQEFFKTTAVQFGKQADAAGNLPPQHRLVQFSADDPLKATLEGIAFPNEIANAVEKLSVIPAAPGTVAKLASGATALWKGYATRANPGFHVRNGVSNMIQTWFGGLGDTGTMVFDPLVVMTKHAKAATYVKNRANLPGKIGAYTATDISKALDDYGVIGGAHTAFNEIDDVITAELDHAGKGFVGRNLNPLDKRNAGLRAGATAGNAIENTSRMALFVDQLEKGKSLEDAALHVRKYLFDYSELTDFERATRDRVLPFYTWLRKNIPLQIDNVLTQPHKVAAFGKGFDAIQDVNADAGTLVSDSDKEPWMRDHLQLPMQSESGAPTFIAPSLPMLDLNKLTPNVEKDGLAALNPLLRIPLELTTNKQYFSGAPVYKEELLDQGGGLKRANPVAKLVNRFLGPLGDLAGIQETSRGVEMPALADYAMRQFPPVTTMGRVAGLATDDPDAAPDNIAGLDPNALSLLGLPTRVLSPEQQKAAHKRTGDQLKAAIKKQRQEAKRKASAPKAPPKSRNRFLPQ